MKKTALLLALLLLLPIQSGAAAAAFGATSPVPGRRSKNTSS